MNSSSAAVRWFLLTLCAVSTFGACATVGSTPGRNGPSAAPVSSLPSSKLSADLSRSDTPVVSSPEEVVEFSKIDVDPYYLGPGDTLRLRASGNEFPEEEIRVSPDNKVAIPVIGELALDRTEVKTLEAEVNARLKRFYTNIDCKLTLVAALNRKVSLLGSVRSPGIISLEGNMSLIDVIAKAGGFESTPGENPSVLMRSKILCRILRDNGKTIWVDLKAILFQNASFYNIRVKNNDIIFVFRQ